MQYVRFVYFTHAYPLAYLFKSCYTKNAENENLLTLLFEWGISIPRKNIREGIMSTYIKLYRSLLENDILANDNTSYIVFTKILLRVNWKTGVLRTGRKKLGLMTNLKDTTAWAALHRLANDGILTLRVTGRYTDIHICNWAKYQTDVDTLVDSSLRANEQPNDTINKNKRSKNIYKGSNEPVENSQNNQSVEINDMFQYWNDTTGLPIVSRQKANRYACSNLLKKYGQDGVQRLIKGVKRSQGDQFAPRIADFTQLQSRLNEFMLWAKKLDIPEKSIGGTAKTSGKFDHMKNLSRRELNEMA